MTDGVWKGSYPKVIGWYYHFECSSRKDIILGPKPSEDSKLSPEVFSVILQLDEVLKDEES